MSLTWKTADFLKYYLGQRKRLTRFTSLAHHPVKQLLKIGNRWKLETVLSIAATDNLPGV